MEQSKPNDILINKGWESMHVLLDGEMPVKKKRRFILWWLLGAFLVMSLGGLFIYNNLNSTKINHVVGIENSKQNQKENKTAVLEDNVEENQNATRDKKKEDNQLESDAEVEQTAVNAESAKVVDLTNNTKVKESADDKIQSNKTLKSNTKLVSSPSKQLETPSIATASNTENKVTIAIDDSDSVIAIAPTVETNIATTKDVSISKPDDVESKASTNLESEEESVTTIPVQENNKQENTLIVSDESEKSEKEMDTNNYNSRLKLNIPKLVDLKIDFGLDMIRDITITRIQPLKKKPNNLFFLQGGIVGNYGTNTSFLATGINVEAGYSINDRIEFSAVFGIGKTFISSNTISDDELNSFALAADKSTNLVRSGLKNFNTINLGLKSNFNIDNHWSISAAFGYYHLWNTSFDKSRHLTTGNTGGAEVLDAPLEGAEVDASRGEETQLQDADYVLDKSWVPYWQLGLDFKIRKNVKFGVEYTNALSDIFESSNSALSLDNIQIGLKYRFFESARKQ